MSKAIDPRERAEIHPGLLSMDVVYTDPPFNTSRGYEGVSAKLKEIKADWSKIDKELTSALKLLKAGKHMPAAASRDFPGGSPAAASPAQRAERAADALRAKLKVMVLPRAPRG